MIESIEEDLKKVANSEDISFDSTYEDEMASVYDVFYSCIDGWYESQEKIIREKAEGDILELACGTGILLSRLEDLGVGLTGVDSSPHMIEVASKRVSENVSLVETDFNNLGYKNEFGTVVMLGNPINHYELDELSGLFSGIYNALEDGGIVIYDLIPASSWESGESINISTAEVDNFEIIRSAFSVQQGITENGNRKNKVHFTYRITDNETGSSNSVNLEENLFSHSVEEHEEFLREKGFSVIEKGYNEMLEDRDKYLIIARKN